MYSTDETGTTRDATLAKQCRPEQAGRQAVHAKATRRVDVSVSAILEAVSVLLCEDGSIRSRNGNPAAPNSIQRRSVEIARDCTSTIGDGSDGRRGGR